MWMPRRSASSGSVLDNTPGLSQRLSQAADPSLFRVPSESTVQPSVPTPAPPAPPLPAVNTGGLADALKSAQLRKTSRVNMLFVTFTLHLPTHYCSGAFTEFVSKLCEAVASPG